MSVPRFMLALVAVALLGGVQGCDREITTVVEETTPQSCFECHGDQNTFLVAAQRQWENSFHASGLRIQEGESATCAGCHISEGFIQRTKGETVTAEPSPTVIHCFTCHQPHTEGNFGLRWTADAVLENGTTYDLSAGNLCAACHHSRRNVNTYVGVQGTAADGTKRLKITSTHWGPHLSPQADLLIGSNGYQYKGKTYTITPHRSATRDGCLDCHFKSTSNNVVGGHSFNMRGDARDEGGEFSTLLNTAACVPCHNQLDDFNYNGAQEEIDGLAEELHDIFVSAGILAADGSVKAPFTTSVDTAGALWNFLLIEEDRSHGVHNYEYAKGLLETALQYLGHMTAATVPTEAGYQSAMNR